jgi:hypothetical protein
MIKEGKLEYTFKWNLNKDVGLALEMMKKKIEN